MIVTVTPNPAIDITIEAATLTLGASHVIAASRRRAGGKGLNVARVLTQTGHRAAALGPVGGVDLDWFAEDLPGVEVRLTACAGTTRSTFALVETGIGRTSQLNESGAARSAAEWADVVDAMTAAAVGASCLTVSGSLPPGSPVDIVPRMLAAGTDAGIPVIADLTGPALIAAARAGADVVKPNRDEVHATVGTADPIAGARLLHAEGARLVLVSLGAEGLVAVPAGARAMHARLPEPLRGNATGAGDAAVAAVAAAIDAGADPAADLEQIARQAVAWSAAAVLAPLAGALDPSYPDLAARVRIDPA